MNSPEEQIQAVWAVEQEILDVVDKVCRENGLRYSLMYGTLLGAVRHGGFIPWDDDVDIMMPREDYNNLIEIWEKTAPKEYLIQNYHNSPDMDQNFTKIRKNHTTFLQSEENFDTAYHKGIFIDIFPGDRVAPGRVGKRLQYAACAVNLLFARGRTSGATGVIGAIEKILLRIPKCMHAKLRDYAQTYFCRWNGKAECKYVFASTIRSVRRHYAADLFDNMTTISFQGKSYPCIAKVDEVLKGEYGNYMQLPPEDQRTWRHLPVCIDFEKNYEEIGACR